MRDRKAIDWGAGMQPGQAWSAYKRDIHKILVESVTEIRLRNDIAPPQEDALPGG